MSKTILCIEDSDIIQTVITYIIKATGCDFVTAGDGVDGINKLKNRHYDMVLLDIRMPNMDGFEFLQTFREHSMNPDVPVLVIASYTEDKDKAIELGACGFIEKPFDPKVLVSKIKDVLKMD